MPTGTSFPGDRKLAKCRSVSGMVTMGTQNYYCYYYYYYYITHQEAADMYSGVSVRLCVCNPTSVSKMSQKIHLWIFVKFMSDTPYILPWKCLTFCADHLQDG